MKHILIITFLAIIGAGCGTGKNATEAATTTTTTETIVENDNQEEITDPEITGNSEVLLTNGVIRDKSEDGCGFVIQMMVDASTPSSTYYEPLKLPEAYQVEGKSIRIQYRLSRRPSNCTLAIPIIIDEILNN